MKDLEEYAEDDRRCNEFMHTTFLCKWLKKNNRLHHKLVLTIDIANYTVDARTGFTSTALSSDGGVLLIGYPYTYGGLHFGSSLITKVGKGTFIVL